MKLYTPVIAEYDTRECKTDGGSASGNNLDDNDTQVSPQPQSRGQSRTQNDTSSSAIDSGLWAWAATVGGHLTLMNTWGFNSSFGLFQPYYERIFDRSPDDISWIGSVQIFLLFFIGTFAGRMTDAGYFRYVFIIGSILTSLGVFMASISTQYWQILLSQGICVGIGNSLVFTPALAIVGTYFKQRRSLAYGLTATGTATGGLIFPAIARQLIPQIGLPWTLRAMGLVQLVTFVAANFLLKTRLPPRRSGPLVEWAAFEDLEFTFFACGMFSAFWGMYFAFYYISRFATTQLSPPMSYISSLNLVLVINGVGWIGRFVPNLFADRYFGPITLIIPFSFVGGVCFLSWIAVNSETGLYIWAAVYGIAAGGVQSLFPASLTRLTADASKIGVRMGMVCTTNSISTLTGPPITGAIIKMTNGRYDGAQAFAGASMILAAVFFFASRTVAVRKMGEGWKAKI